MLNVATIKRKDYVDLPDADKRVFTRGSSMNINGKRIPDGMIVSVCVHCAPGVQPPLNFGYADQRAANGCSIWITDNAGTPVAAWRVSKDPCQVPGIATRPLLDENNVVKGHIAYEPAVVDIILNNVGRGQDKRGLGRTSFVLSPACLQPLPKLGMRAVCIGPTGGARPVVAPVVIEPSSGAITTPTGGGGLAIGLLKTTTKTRKYGFQWLSLDNVDTINDEQVDPSNQSSGKPLGRYDRLWIGGCHLMFRHGITSNVRVTNTGDGIAIKGVLDG